ncbi:MAG: sugar phosphate isomerase/epimerase [Planctomycetaceae bacterium]|nr:sugar phosphate isomerase/epimerase [Planctomycetaceae bacterium]
MLTPLNRRRMLRLAARATGAAAVASLPIFAEVGRGDGTKATTFKYAICNETFGDWPLEKAFRFAAECGYRGIEIAPFTIARNVVEIDATRRKEIRKLAERAGLEVVGLHWLLAKTEGYHLTTDDADVRRRTAGYLGKLAQFCADLGGRMMVLGSPQQRNLATGVTKAEGMKRAAEVLREVVPVLEKTGVTMAIEPLGPAETNFINTAADGVELAKLVDSPRCRLHLDCKAMVTEPTPIPEVIRKYHHWCVHFHANDPNRRGPGFGKLDFVPIFQALRDVDYRGWVSVEVFDYSPGVERLARESIEYMRKCEGRLLAK